MKSSHVPHCRMPQLDSQPLSSALLSFFWLLNSETFYWFCWRHSPPPIKEVINANILFPSCLCSWGRSTWPQPRQSDMLVTACESGAEDQSSRHLSILLVSERCASVAGAASSPGRRRGQRFSHWPQMTQYWVNSQNCKRKCQRDQASKWTTRARSGDGGGHVNSRSRVFSYEHLPLSSSHLYSCRDRSPALPAQIFQEKRELWILCEPDGQPIETHKLKLTVWGYTDEHVPVTEREVKAASLLHFVRLQVTNSIK